MAGNYKICLLNIALARKHNYKARSEPKLADGRTSSADGEASQSEEPTPAASGLEQAGERGDLRRMPSLSRIDFGRLANTRLKHVSLNDIHDWVRL
ncbi:hypothetical protein pipiens_009375 [Culex pipiens pipiens]|uniref:Uncharacterized protein n=1 Tax=Culex pipiens pipiens TaxID=38569 RepID=A0ABD1CFT0_CULPP